MSVVLIDDNLEVLGTVTKTQAAQLFYLKKKTKKAKNIKKKNHKNHELIIFNGNKLASAFLITNGAGAHALVLLDRDR